MLAQILFSGLTLGSIYGLVALGFTVVYKATHVFNFAQGMLMACGAYLAVTASSALQLPLAGICLFVVLCAGLLGVAIHRVFIKPLAGQPLLPLIMITIALSIILRALIEMIYGGAPRTLDFPLPGTVWQIGEVRVSGLHATAALVSWACMALFALLFRFTRIGLLMRATADGHEAAVLSGVDVDRINATAWAIGTVLAAVGGVFLGKLQVASVELEAIGLLALPAVVIGGLQSVPGAVLGGLLVGLIEQLASGYISPKARDVMVYAPLLVLLMIRPWGLLGHKELGRV